MKRNLFFAIALTVGALFCVSCDKEKSDNGSANQFLTLEQQQEIIQQSANQIAGKVDFTSFVPVIDAASELDGINVSYIWEAIFEDSVSGPRLNKFVAQLLGGDSILLDCSLIRMGFEFDIVDSTDISYGDTTIMRIPVVSKRNYNTDSTYIVLNTRSHRFQLNFLAASENTQIEIETLINDEEIVNQTNNHLVSLPRQLKFELVVDGSKAGLLELNADTDFKIRETQDGFSYQGNKLNLSVNMQLGDFFGNLLLNYSESAGITLAGSLSMSNANSRTELIGLTLKADADMNGLGNSLNKEELVAWAMNDSRLRGIELNMSLFDKMITGELRLNNPVANGKLPSSIVAMMTADTITSEMAKKVADDINPFIKSGLYIKGYAPAQARLEIASMDIESEMFEDDILEILNWYKLAPMIKISADNSLVGFDEYLGGIDIEQAIRTIASSFDSTFGKFGISIDDILDMISGDSGRIIE